MSTDVIARVQHLAARQARESDGRAARNRLRFPVHAAVLDEWRAVFGPGVRWTYLYDESGSMGRPGPKGVPLSDWLPRELRDKWGRK